MALAENPDCEEHTLSSLTYSWMYADARKDVGSTDNPCNNHNTTSTSRKFIPHKIEHATPPNATDPPLLLSFVLIPFYCVVPPAEECLLITLNPTASRALRTPEMAVITDGNANRSALIGILTWFFFLVGVFSLCARFGSKLFLSIKITWDDWLALAAQVSNRPPSLPMPLHC